MKLLFVFLSLISAPLLAHDFWIEPSTYSPRKGERVALRLRVGEHFLGDAIPRMPSSITSFQLLSSSPAVAVTGPANAEPAGAAAMPTANIAVGAYASRGTVAAMDAATFARYVREEGLERAARATGVNPTKPVRDSFARCAKVLLRGEGAATGFDRVAGMTLELVPLTNPFTTKAPAAMKFRLLYRGKPLSGALITAIPKTRPSAQVTARSDASGSVTLPIGRRGEWLVKAVHLIRATSTDADVESYWASLTFRLEEAK